MAGVRESRSLQLKSPLETTSLVPVLRGLEALIVEAILLVIDKGRPCKMATEKRWNSSKSFIGFFH